MGLDAGLNIGILRKGASSWYDIEVMYFRKCYSISRDIRNMFNSYVRKNDSAIVESTDYSFRLKLPITDAAPAHQILYEIREILSAEQDMLFELYGTENDYEYEAFWSVGPYTNIISSNFNSIQVLIMYLEKRIDFDDLCEALHLEENGENYVEDNILPCPDKWDWDNAYITFYYSE